MSRIAKYPVVLPKGVEATISAGEIRVKGPLGTMTQSLTDRVRLQQDEGQITFTVADESREAKAMSGTLRALVANMVTGVNTGFERKLNLVGVGFRAQLQGNALKRSEEHTSELQSLMRISYAVFCLKKKKKHT